MSRHAIEMVLKDVFGDHAELVWHERTKRSPLNLVLAEIDRQLGSEHALCWVHGGTPELVSYPGFVPQTVAYSSRYVELCGMLRLALTGPWDGDLREEVVRRLLTKTVAELALRHGDPDFAVEALLESTVGQGITLLDNNTLLDLEALPINESYAAVWFFGLAHEYGHAFWAAQGRDSLVMFPQHAVEAAIGAALEAVNLPEATRAKTVERARNEPKDFCLGWRHLAEEAACDAFASDILLKSTITLMREVGAQVQPEYFLAECMLARVYVFALRQCRLLAELDSETAASHDKATEAMLLPAALFVRARLQKVYLEYAMAGLGGEPTEDRRVRWGRIIDGVEESLDSTFTMFNKAIGKVTQYVLKPELRPLSEWQLLEAFRRETASNPMAGSRFAAEELVNVANGLAQGKLLTAIQGILLNPEQPLHLDPSGDHTFFVPFVKGHGRSRPFGLDTRHGHLVFVFAQAGTLYETYSRVSAEVLADGFSLESAVVAVSRTAKLLPTIAAHMPKGSQFRLVVEGTDEFNRLMLELSKDEIW